MTTPFFSRLCLTSAFEYMSLQIWRATLAKEKRDQRRDTQRRRAHQRSASFREKTAFLRRRERGGGRGGGRVDAERLERDVVFAKFTQSKGRGTPVG